MLGVALAVASTVVLIRVLTDNKQLDTQAGTVAVGWLIVEDLLTVVVLVLIPAFGTGDPDHPAQSLWIALPMAFLKLAVLVVIVLILGGRFVPWVMVKVAKLRSRELFTLTVLVMAISVAAGSAKFFGVSMALGAFLGGMVVGRSSVSQQAGADLLPLRDAFAVLFFASVGMLFDYHVIFEHPGLMAMGLLVVLVAKPLAALVIIAIIGYPARTGLVVALGLAQIGEFSFILTELGRSNGLLDEAGVGHNVIVGTAIVSITLNPLIFRLLPKLEKLLQSYPALWKFMNRNDESRQVKMNDQTENTLQKEQTSLAVIIGYGPVGRAVDAALRERNIETVVIDQNVDTVERLHRENRAAIYGDAFNIEVIAQALPRASHLIITLPHSQNRTPLIVSAKLINPETKVFVRARYIGEREELIQVGADAACYEEAEAAVALSRLVLNDVGANEAEVGREVIKIRQQYKAVLPA
ncbi:MAG: cation:proton antiporter [Tepidisphaeraceae bacterium]